MTHTVSSDTITQRLYRHHRQAFYKIRDMLPPPFEETQEGYAERDEAVIEAIVQLVPVNASETELAAMAVAGNQLWMHYQCEATRKQHDKQEHDRLAAQASRVGRDARGYLVALDRAQKMRVKRESTEAGAFQADIIEENGRTLMLAALADPPRGARAAAQAAGPAEQAAAASAATNAPAVATTAAPPQAGPAPACVQGPELAPAEPAMPAEVTTAEAEAPAPVLHLNPVPRVFPKPAASRRSRAKDDDWPEPDWAEEAERYAVIYPGRARLIRSLGGVPEDCRFGPPEDKLVRAIVAGTTPHLRELDGPDAGKRRYA